MMDGKTGETAVMNHMCEEDLTPKEIRRTLLQLSQHEIDEQGARAAIEALKKIMRAAASSGVRAGGDESTE